MRFGTLNVRTCTGQVHLQLQPENYQDMNDQLGTEFSVNHRTVPSVKSVEFVSDRMSCIVLRVR
jgi:hypothetical protein